MIKTGILKQQLPCALHTHLDLEEGSKTAILALFKWHCVCIDVFGFQDKVVKKPWLPGLYIKLLILLIIPDIHVVSYTLDTH